MVTIKNIIVHEVKKDDGESDFKLDPREEENPIDEHAEKLVKELTSLFRKTGLSTGKFVTPETEDDPKPHFVTVLENHFDGSSFDDFIAFSKAETETLGSVLTFQHKCMNVRTDPKISL